LIENPRKKKPSQKKSRTSSHVHPKDQQHQYGGGEQVEFDQKMQQVTNLLKELKNNSSGGYTSHATTNPPIYDDKSLKV